MYPKAANFATDGIAYFKINQLDIKLYTDLKQPELEEATEAVLLKPGEITFDTPVAMPGAVFLALDPNGEPESFYADGIEYYIIANNIGHQGAVFIICNIQGKYNGNFVKN